MPGKCMVHYLSKKLEKKHIKISLMGSSGCTIFTFKEHKSGIFSIINIEYDLFLKEEPSFLVVSGIHDFKNLATSPVI